jgi:hypothetical protein
VLVRVPRGECVADPWRGAYDHGGHQDIVVGHHRTGFVDIMKAMNPTAEVIA